LRLIVADQGKVDEGGLKALGARGVLRPSAEALQVVLGPIADAVAMDIRAALDRPLDASPEPAPSTYKSEALPDSIARLLGGSGNIRSASYHHGRWRVELLKDDLLSETGSTEPIRTLIKVAPNLVHILVS
jgi:PTS system N-acetylglucosamine-specific IIC component